MVSLFASFESTSEAFSAAPSHEQAMVVLPQSKEPPKLKTLCFSSTLSHFPFNLLPLPASVNEKPVVLVSLPQGPTLTPLLESHFRSTSAIVYGPNLKPSFTNAPLAWLRSLTGSTSLELATSDGAAMRGPAQPLSATARVHCPINIPTFTYPVALFILQISSKAIPRPSSTRRSPPLFTLHDPRGFPKIVAQISDCIRPTTLCGFSWKCLRGIDDPEQLSQSAAMNIGVLNRVFGLGLFSILLVACGGSDDEPAANCGTTQS